MKSQLYGALCLVAFAFTSAVHLSGSYAHDSSQDTTSITVTGETVVLDPAKAKETRKATSLAAVGWKDCGPCKRLKRDTLRPLLKEGYNVGYSLEEDWDGPAITSAPTLFYMIDGEIIRTEIGFKTAEYVKEYLTK